MATSTPMLARRILAQMLKRLRLSARIEIGVAAVHVGCNRTTVQRWENGQVAPKPPAVKSLGELYEAGTDQLDLMDTLSRQSNQRGIWEGPTVPSELRVLYESEITATAIRAIELEHIPGLLQTPEYLRVMQSHVPSEPNRQESIRAMRQQRQEILWARRDTPALQWVVGTSALRYLNRWPEIKQGQIDEMRHRIKSHDADIRVVDTFHQAMTGSFTLIETEFADNTLVPFTFAYIEMLDGGRYVEDRNVVSTYQAAFAAVHESAITLEEYLT